MSDDPSRGDRSWVNWAIGGIFEFGVEALAVVVLAIVSVVIAYFALLLV